MNIMFFKLPNLFVAFFRHFGFFIIVFIAIELLQVKFLYAESVKSNIKDQLLDRCKTTTGVSYNKFQKIINGTMSLDEIDSDIKVQETIKRKYKECQDIVNKSIFEPNAARFCLDVNKRDDKYLTSKLPSSELQVVHDYFINCLSEIADQHVSDKILFLCKNMETPNVCLMQFNNKNISDEKMDRVELVQSCYNSNPSIIHHAITNIYSIDTFKRCTDMPECKDKSTCISLLNEYDYSHSVLEDCLDKMIDTRKITCLKNNTKATMKFGSLGLDSCHRDGDFQIRCNERLYILRDQIVSYNSIKLGNSHVENIKKTRAVNVANIDNVDRPSIKEFDKCSRDFEYDTINCKEGMYIKKDSQEYQKIITDSENLNEERTQERPVSVMSK